MMPASERLSCFSYCPRCGKPSVRVQGGKAVSCTSCDLLLFLNVAAAVGAIIADDAGRILLVRRDREPRKGKLGAPGGFIDAGESVEVALAREVKEEVNLEIATMRYLISYPNDYLYRGICYPTTDMFFACTVKSFEPLRAMDEVESIVFRDPADLTPDEIAFPSLYKAIQTFRVGFRPPSRSQQSQM